jgi:hypothetical protein
MPGPGPASRAVFVMLVMRKSSQEARSALIPWRPDAMKPRFQCVLAQ